MTSTLDLQKKLVDALDLLRQSHPEIDANLPVAYLQKYNIFSSFLPYEKDLNKMTATQKDQLKYYKTFWIIQQLLIKIHAILHDPNSESLKNVAKLCLKNAPQLNDLFGKQKKLQANHKKSSRMKTKP